MRIGFVGLGAIGTPMAARLAAIHEVKVWNRTEAKALAFVAAHQLANQAATLRDLASWAEAIVTCLP